MVLGSGTLGLVDALAVIECRVEERIDRHDHALLIGAVTDVRRGSAGAPLVYLEGCFSGVLTGRPLTCPHDGR